MDIFKVLNKMEKQEVTVNGKAGANYHNRAISPNLGLRIKPVFHTWQLDKVKEVGSNIIYFVSKLPQRLLDAHSCFVPQVSQSRMTFGKRMRLPTEPVEYRYVDGKDYGIYAASSGYVKEAALEAARLSIMRRTESRDIFKIPANVAKTKKPEGSRMGGGKGKIDHYVALVKAGTVILEFNCESEFLAKKAYKEVTNRLPIKTHFRVKPKFPIKVLTLSEFRDMYKSNTASDS